VQRTTSRRTPVCVEPDQRPNLRVATFEAQAGPDAETTRYVLSIVNDGRTAAGAFDVDVVGAPDAVRTVPGLPAGEHTTVELVGPRCSVDRPVGVRLDVADVVEESDERDNHSRWACGAR
jgi:subtilase family serine protease